MTILKKRLIWALVLISCLHSQFALAQVQTNQLDNLASRLLSQSSYPLNGRVVASASQSGGYAAIVWRGNTGTIYAHPSRMQSESLNTWAFVIGHELAHNIHQHQGGSSQKEFQADRTGAKLAIDSRYNLKSYVRRLYRDPNSCSMSHGCWHSRARALEQHFGVTSGKWDPTHLNHAKPSQHFPPILNARQTRPNQGRTRQVPCRHKMQCAHRMPCGHFVNTPYGPQPAHPFDTRHKYDTSHPFDLVPI